jgi:hypothetical protein
MASAAITAVIELDRLIVTVSYPSFKAHGRSGE